MKRILCWMAGLAIAYGATAQENRFELKKELPKQLKEISGITRDGNVLWAIDDNRSDLFKLDLQGNVIQQIRIAGITLEDAESVSADARYVYVGDIGDNNGRRESRTIVRVEKSGIGSGDKEEVSGTLIHFTFPDEGTVKKKKSNNFDCEAMISYGDSLFLFTKRRDDEKTALYALSKTPGTYQARHISTFKVKGLVTDADVNAEGTEVALVGYDEGHTRPFIYLLRDFRGHDFFSGTQQRFELTNEKKLDWQIESISYRDDKTFYLSCEKTPDVPNTLYVVGKSELLHSKKG